MRALILSLSLLVAVLAAGCGPTGIGAECHYVLTERGCVDGAFCTPARSAPVPMGTDPTWDNAVCRAICEAPGDCPMGEECRSVPGAERYLVCQPLVETETP